VELRLISCNCQKSQVAKSGQVPEFHILPIQMPPPAQCRAGRMFPFALPHLPPPLDIWPRFSTPVDYVSTLMETRQLIKLRSSLNDRRSVVCGCSLTVWHPRGTCTCTAVNHNRYTIFIRDNGSPHVFPPNPLFFNPFLSFFPSFLFPVFHSRRQTVFKSSYTEPSSTSCFTARFEVEPRPRKSIAG